MLFADIIVDISIDKLDKTFQYMIPDELADEAEIGSQVNIHFGKRKMTGYIVNITDTPSFDIGRMKLIDSVVKGSVPIENRMIKLAYWMKRNYGSTINQALKTVLPVKETVREKKEKYISLTQEYADDREKVKAYIAECERRHYTAKNRLLNALLIDDILDEDIVKSKLNISQSTIKSLVEQGIVALCDNTVYRNPIHKEYAISEKPQLNAEQQFVANGIISDYDKDMRETYLIKGVTGSGKTEVYLEIIEHVLNAGRQVIMLIPEIALTYQTVMRFYRRFGNVVSILNSRMSKGERYDQYLRAKRGEIKIMIGPRSALFTPFDNLGLIVIDEEHETAYKSDSVPKYHARETAIQLAAMCNASVILGSATPSVDAYYNARRGKYKLYVLNNRAKESTLPEVETVDLRDELKQGNKSVICRRLKSLIEDRLCKKEQIMLFLNRRGYVGFINCRECGHVIKCPHCDVALTVHGYTKNNRGSLMCHYCGYTEPNVNVCPSCGSKYIGGFKVGTEQIEGAVKQMFPTARVLRMDLDTTREKDGHEKILESFADGEADILVGTQMIVKGHDFPRVTLVGILLADLSLYSSDFRAQERTFELLTQAAGRAGRGNIPGQVVIQSYNPEHFSIRKAVEHDYDGFYEQEIGLRSLMDYPPVSNLMSIKFSSKDEAGVNAAAAKVKKLIAEREKDIVKEGIAKVDIVKEGIAKEDTVREDIVKDDSPYSIIGPAKAPIYKINDIFSMFLYIKHKEYTILTHIKDIIEAYTADNNDIIFKNVNIQFDFNQ